MDQPRIPPARATPCRVSHEALRDLADRVHFGGPDEKVFEAYRELTSGGDSARLAQLFHAARDLRLDRLDRIGGHLGRQRADLLGLGRQCVELLRGAYLE